MRGQIVTKSTATENKDKEIDNSGITILDEMGITMRECTPEEINEIKERFNLFQYKTVDFTLRLNIYKRKARDKTSTLADI